jgi:hypothetical protein
MFGSKRGDLYTARLLNVSNAFPVMSLVYSNVIRAHNC